MPSKYRDEFAEQARNYCSIGATNAQLAAFFGVSRTTIDTWLKIHPEFVEAVADGKAVADANVEQSLYRRAIGYEHPEDKIFCNADGKVTTVTTIKRYPPDTGAAAFWLKNRAGWRDRYEHEIDATVEHQITDEPLDDATWAEQYENLANSGPAH